jgi:dipeptidyl aminopeptidase/acylaminoacyl peptidase
MRPMSIMKYKTRDGRQLDAYVTLPAGASKEKPAPLVVMPHGGPWVRDTWGFDSRAQYFASRGYAVLQPNYRGSPGYEWLFPEEDKWEFRKMHEDVTDATRAVFRTGFVDRQRVAIFGSSFGGYLALCGVAFEPDLYRCAVTFAGLFDWATTIKDAKFSQHTNPEYAVLLRRLGDPKQQEEKFTAISPLASVDKVKVPVFVAHGKEDTVVSAAESRRLVAELKRLRLPHEVMMMSDEGHGVSRLRTEVQFYSRIESFLHEHLAAR